MFLCTSRHYYCLQVCFPTPLHISLHTTLTCTFGTKENTLVFYTARKRDMDYPIPALAGKEDIQPGLERSLKGPHDTATGFPAHTPTTRRHACLSSLGLKQTCSLLPYPAVGLLLIFHLLLQSPSQMFQSSQEREEGLQKKNSGTGSIRKRTERSDRS